MSALLPIRVTADHISLAGKHYQGTALGYEFIALNPQHPSRYVVVIGMNQWISPQGWKLHPSKEGICDYFVFDLQDSAARLEDAGYFDASVWQRFAATASTVGTVEQTNKR